MQSKTTLEAPPAVPALDNALRQTLPTTATMNAPAAAPLTDDVFRAPLPGLVMGDAAVRAPRRHGWPGRLFLGLGYLTAVGCALGAGALLCFAAFGMESAAEVWKPAVAASVWGVLQWRLSKAVSRFSRWGWIGAMAELAGAGLAKIGLAVAMPATIPSAVVLLAINGAWMRYFWKRRAQFDVDLGG
jgi:hypothetical protein